jgi:hypothetical protein
VLVHRRRRRIARLYTQRWLSNDGVYTGREPSAPPDFICERADAGEYDRNEEAYRRRTCVPARVGVRGGVRAHPAGTLGTSH